MAQAMYGPATILIHLQDILVGMNGLSERIGGLEKSMKGLSGRIGGLETLLQRGDEAVAPLISKLSRDRRFVLVCYLQQYREVQRQMDDGADINAEVDIGGEIFEDDSDYEVVRAADRRELRRKFDDFWPSGFYTPLLAALEHNIDDIDESQSVVKLLIRYGASVKVANENGRTPIMLAAKHGFGEVFDLLVKKGAYLDCLDDRNCSALHYACSGNTRNHHYLERVKIVKELVEAGLNVNALGGIQSRYNGQSLTPLMMAAENTKQVGVVKFLAVNGADINTKDGRKRTALHFAARNGDSGCVEALVLAKADVNAMCEADPYDETGMQLPLQLCCGTRTSGKTIKLLIDHGADPNATNNIDGSTALIYASGERIGFAKKKHYEYVGDDLPPPVQIISVLLAAHARPNVSNKQGETSLHKSATYGDLSACKVLLSYGANLFAKDNLGRTPLDLYDTKQSFVNRTYRSQLVAALTPAEKAEHIAGLFEARREYLASPLVEALRSGRVLIAPCAQDPRGFVPRTVRNTIVGHAVLSNLDLVKAITEWL